MGNGPSDAQPCQETNGHYWGNKKIKKINHFIGFSNEFLFNYILNSKSLFILIYYKHMQKEKGSSAAQHLYSRWGSSILKCFIFLTAVIKAAPL